MMVHSKIEDGAALESYSIEHPEDTAKKYMSEIGVENVIDDKWPKYIGETVTEADFIIKGAHGVPDGAMFTIERSASTSSSYKGFGKSSIGSSVGFFRLSYNSKTVGRLSINNSRIFGGLLDLGWVDLKVCLVFAPPNVSIMDQMIIQIQVFIKRIAFNIMREDSDIQPEEVDLHRGWIKSIFDSISLKPAIPAVQLINSRKNGVIKSGASDKVSTEQIDEVLANNCDVSVLEDTDYIPTPDGLNVELRQYQKQGLKWLSSREELNNLQSSTSMDPLWSQYEVYNQEVPQDPFIFWYNEFTGSLSLSFPRASDRSRGGILADEMGLGKTLQMLSLIYCNKETNSEIEERKQEISLNSVNYTPATLVITPTSLLDQWVAEILSRFKPGSLKYMIFYGGSRLLDMDLMKSKNAPDIVFTTYGVLQSEHNKMINDPETIQSLYKLHWRRIVLDEGHYIRNKGTGTSKAVLHLEATRRWVVTGTPIQNKIEDIYTLIRFLRIIPWSNSTYWKSAVVIPFERGDPMTYTTLQAILEPIMLRRLKSTKTRSGEPIITLPPKTVEVRVLEFDEKSRIVYEALRKRSTADFEMLVRSGDVMRKWVHIFKLLNQLRQFCLHPSLVLKNENEVSSLKLEIEDMIRKFDESDQEFVKKMKTSLIEIQNKSSQESEQTVNELAVKGEINNTDINDEKQNISSDDETDEKTCKICFEYLEDPGILPCMHTFCYGCLIEYIKSREERNLEGECPVCRAKCTEDDVLEVVVRKDNSNQLSDSNELSSTPEPSTENILSFRKRKRFQSSSKLDALITYLKEVRKEGEDIKVVAFSQYTSFLNIVQEAFSDHNIKYVRFDGTLSREKKVECVEKFRTEPEIRVLLASSRAAGVGLNLTCASRVVLLDPWWNSAFESQAIDRVHRFGQTRPVFVIRFVMKDSIEERMLEIQANKKVLVAAVDGIAPNSSESPNQRVNDVRTLLS